MGIISGALLKKQNLKPLARERIDILISGALREQDRNLVSRYARLAKKIAMRFRVQLPYDIRQLYCKKCKRFIIPGRDARVRLGRSHTKAARITCFRCGHVYRKILSPE